MDYYSIIILVIITFIFITDRKIKDVDFLKNQNSNILYEINDVKHNLIIAKLDFEKITKNNLDNLTKNNNTKYILLENSLLNIDEEKRDTIIANFIDSKKKLCGFNVNYSYINDKRINLKRLFVSLINYLNIFNKNDITTYGAIILDIKDINKIQFLANKKIICKEIISYVQNKKYLLNLNIFNFDAKKYLQICIKKIYSSNPKFLLKFVLFFTVGFYITANLVNSIYNIQNNITSFVITLTIYLCYSYILKYIYEPVGKERIIASYIFPVYFFAYFFILVYIMVNKKIKYNFN